MGQARRCPKNPMNRAKGHGRAVLPEMSLCSRAGLRPGGPTAAHVCTARITPRNGHARRDRGVTPAFSGPWRYNLNGLTPRLHGPPACLSGAVLLYCAHGPRSPSSMVCCCDFRDGAERPFLRPKCPRSAVFSASAVNNAPAAPPPLWGLPGHEKRTPTTSTP